MNEKSLPTINKLQARGLKKSFQRKSVVKDMVDHIIEVGKNETKNNVEIPK